MYAMIRSKLYNRKNSCIDSRVRQKRTSNIRSQRLAYYINLAICSFCICTNSAHVGLIACSVFVISEQVTAVGINIIIGFFFFLLYITNIVNTENIFVSLNVLPSATTATSAAAAPVAAGAEAPELTEVRKVLMSCPTRALAKRPAQ